MDCIRTEAHNHMTGYVSDHCRCDKCLEAGQSYHREWQRDNRKAEGPEIVARRAQAHREKKARWFADIKMESGCVECGYKKHPAALDFHHRDPATKLFSLGSKVHSYGKERIIEEIEKCDVLCANCHRSVYGNRGYRIEAINAS